MEKEGGPTGSGSAGLKVLETIKRHLVEIGDSRLDCIVCLMLVDTVSTTFQQKPDEDQS